MQFIAILPLVAFAAGSVFAQTGVEQVRDLNAKVLGLHAQGQKTSADAGSVFSQRWSALSALIERDPEQALRLAFPADLIEELVEAYPQQKAKFETHGEWQGPVESFILDGAKSKSIVRLRTGNENVSLHFAGRSPSFQSRDVLSVSRGARRRPHRRRQSQQSGRID